MALCIPPGCSKTKLGIFTFSLFHYFGGNTTRRPIKKAAQCSARLGSLVAPLVRSITRLKKPYRPSGRYGKVSNYQIASLIKVSILNATYRESVCSVFGEHVSITAIEEEAARIGTTNRTAPTAAVGTDNEERTIAVVAFACHGQFKW